MKMLWLWLLLAAAIIAAVGAIWGLAGWPSLIAPGEPAVVAVRAWIAAAGPAVALLAALVAGAIGFQNLSVSRAALVAADRPWVGFDTIQIAPIALGSSSAATIVWRNTGRSPAHMAAMYFSAKAPLVAEDKSPLAVPDIPADNQRQIVLPNAAATSVVWENVPPLTQEQADEINNGIRVLRAAGRAEYFDAFGARHSTTFQAVYSPRLKAFVAEGEQNLAD